MGDASQRRATAFAAGVAAGALALAALVLGAAPVKRWIDDHAPDASSTALLVHVEKQVLHAEVGAPAEGPVVIFIGSSAVVNGVDEAAVNAAWRACGLGWEARNFAATDLRAYELPMLARLQAGQEAEWVYLYNGFSFGDAVKREALPIRWDTREAVALLGTRLWDLREEAAAGIAGEHIALVRYGDLYRDVAWRALTGRLARVTSRYDYGVDDARTYAPRSRAGDARDEALRVAYLESEGGGETLGWRGLRRFLALASERGQAVVLGAVAEPAAAQESEPARRGTHPQVVRDAVARIAMESGASSLPPALDIESDTSLFRDAVHLNARGRARYSAFLAIEAARAGRGRFAAGEAALDCLRRRGG